MSQGETKSITRNAQSGEKLKINCTMGCRQVVRHLVLVQAFVGSSPTIPANQCIKLNSDPPGSLFLRLNEVYGIAILDVVRDPCGYGESAARGSPKD